jgi:hypothetical protein
MKVLNQRTVQVCVFGGAIAALGLFTPRAAHAVAAALVEVTNGFSNPVISQSITTAASQQVMLTTQGGGSYSPNSDFFSLYQFSPSQGYSQTACQVPAGQNLVVTDIDITNLGTGGSNIHLCASNSGSGPVNDTEAPNPGTTQFHYHGIVYAAGAPLFAEYSSLTNGAPATIVVYGYLTAN